MEVEIKLWNKMYVISTGFHCSLIRKDCSDFKIINLLKQPRLNITCLLKSVLNFKITPVIPSYLEMYLVK